MVELAGEQGRALESRLGTPLAAWLIYKTSDPDIKSFPNFYCGNSVALEDMKRLAEEEAARQVA